MKVKLIHIVVVVSLLFNLILGVLWVHNTTVITAQEKWIEDEIAGIHEPVIYPVIYKYLKRLRRGVYQIGRR